MYEEGRGVFLIQTPNLMKSNRWTTSGGYRTPGLNHLECISRHIYDDLGIRTRITDLPILRNVTSSNTLMDVYSATLPAGYKFSGQGIAKRARFFAPREIFEQEIELSMDNRTIFEILAKRGFFGDEFRSSCLQTGETGAYKQQP